MYTRITVDINILHRLNLTHPHTIIMALRSACRQGSAPTPAQSFNRCGLGHLRGISMPGRGGFSPGTAAPMLSASTVGAGTAEFELST
jgi:hypothetical protein